MAVPTIYRWDDANAPQITDMGDWNQIKNWFTKIFVDGYLEDDNVTMKPAIPNFEVEFVDAEYKVNVKQTGDSTVHNLEHYTFWFEKMIDGWYGAVRCYKTSHANPQANWNNYRYDDHGLTISLFGTNFNDTAKVTPWVVMGTARQVIFLAGVNDDEDGVPTKMTKSNMEMRCWGFGDYHNDGIDVGINKQWVFTSGRKYYNSVNNNEWYSSNSLGLGGHSGNSWVTISHNYLNQAVCGNDYDRQYGNAWMLVGNSSGYIGNNNIIANPYPDSGLYIRNWDLWHGNVYYGHLNGVYYPLQQRIITINETDKFQTYIGEGQFAGNEFYVFANDRFELHFNISEDWEL